jgi:hypothetical protein
MTPYVPWIAEEDSTLYCLCEQWVTNGNNLRADVWAKRVSGKKSVIFRPGDEGEENSPRLGMNDGNAISSSEEGIHQGDCRVSIEN